MGRSVTLRKHIREVSRLKTLWERINMVEFCHFHQGSQLLGLPVYLTTRQSHSERGLFFKEIFNLHGRKCFPYQVDHFSEWAKSVLIELSPLNLHPVPLNYIEYEHNNIPALLELELSLVNAFVTCMHGS